MKRWQIDYYYLATGMEGRPDIRDYGVVEAETPREARLKVAERECPEAVEWMMSCLSATEAK